MTAAVANQGEVTSDQLPPLPTADPVVGGPTITQVTPPPKPKPAIVVHAPTDGATVTQITPIRAAITPPPGETISSWCVSARESGATTSRQLGCGVGTTTGADILASFDPTTLPNGPYELTVTATASNGASDTETISISVEGALKPGRFTTTYQDLSIPIHSLPIQILRTYDSFDKAKGDFGVGWNVQIANFSVRANRPFGDGGWYVRNTGCLNVLGQNVCLYKELASTRANFVSVRWPDGHVESFDFTPSSGASVHYDATARFTPRRGATSTLEIDGDPYLTYYNDADLYDGGGQDIYDPKAFKLTAKDGTVYHLDTAKGLTRTEDRHGNSLTIDENGVTSSTGKSVTFTRDAQGRIREITGPSGEHLTYAYDAAGDLTTATDARGNTMRFTYDSDHNLLITKDPANRPIRTVTYDEQGRMSSVTDGTGHTTQIDTAADAQSQIITSPDGRLTTVTAYDARGNLTELRELFDGGERSTTYEYDQDDNLTETTDPLGHTTSSTYDARGNQLTSTDARGHTTRYEYDANGRLIKTIEADGAISESMTRNEFGDVTEIVAGGAKTRFAYDGAGRAIATTDPLGRTTATSYDSDGNPIGYASDDGGLIALIGYDESNRPTSFVDPLGRVTTRSYDAEGNLLATTDSSGNSVSSAYDPAGRLTAQTDQLGRTNTLEYDANGRLIRTVDRNHVVKSFEYDSMGKLTAKTASDGLRAGYRYSANGNMVRAENEDASVDLQYDPLNRPTHITTVGVGAASIPTTSADYIYNALGLRKSESFGNQTRDYAYDSKGSLASLTDSATGAFGFGYDARNRLTSISRPNGVITNVNYDAASQVQTIEHRAATVIADRVGYEYDAIGQRSAQIDHYGAHAYAYDTLGGLTSADHPDDQSDESFAYDALGNRVEPGSTFDAANKLTADSWFDYDYDAEGRLIGKTERATGKRTEFSWDSDGHLRSVTESNGQTTRYRYDPAGNRIEIAGPRRTLRYAYGLGGSPLAQYDSSNGLVERFTFSPGVDKPLAMRRGDENYYHLQDALSSVTALTDATGHVVERYQYSAFGEPKSPPSALGNPYTFTGREWDPESSTYHFRARQLDPQLGRFTSQDPVASTNAYVYAGDSPTQFTDPTGKYLSSNELNTGMVVQSDLQKIATTAGAMAVLRLEEWLSGSSNGNRTHRAAFHYTFSERKDSILRTGLRLNNGVVYATPTYGYSPAEAEEYLALPPDPLGLRDAVIGINISALEKSGKPIPPPTRVWPKYGHDGGGWEMRFTYRIEPLFLFPAD